MNRPALKLVVPPPRGAPAASDEGVVEAAIRGDRAARGAIYDRYGDHVHRVLRRLLGAGEDVADLHHDVFVKAIGSLPTLQDRGALKAWLTRIAVFVARDAIAAKQRRRWLWFMPNDELPDVPAAAPSGDARDAVRATYAILDKMAPDDRIAFALRYVDEMELVDVAAACGTSLATIKRRLARAGERFAVAARRSPALQPWLEGGTRWGETSER